MSDNKHTIPVRAIEPSDNRRPGSAPDSVRWSRVSTNADDPLVREYREAFLMIYKVHGQMKGSGSEGKLIETMVDSSVAERQPSIRRTTPQMFEGQLLAAPTDSQVSSPAPPLAGPAPRNLTFNELARRFSEQMDEVVATGKQITAASRQMISGLKDLNDGIGLLKRKLSRVKY
ncbi:MAG: hypothetical protein IH972_03785 [Candidatus Marinimicrobia bacterium]|nr:hypothetical protein [Candidatus Neomarinimicrobiota bacterium]